MKSKYVGKLLFIKDEKYHNRKGKTPYIVLFELKYENRYGFDDIWITGVNMNGQKIHVVKSKKWIYKNLDIIDAKHLEKDFIANIFRNN